MAWSVPLSYSLRIFTIHFLAYIVQFLVFMKHTSQGQIWEGARSTPHTVARLKEMKDHLNSGGKIMVRKDLETAILKQGPKEHKRTEIAGLRLSVKTVNGGGWSSGDSYR